MASQAVVEYCILIDSFRNIDLKRQGLYRLRIEVFTAPSVRSLLALPGPAPQTEDDFIAKVELAADQYALPYYVVKTSLPVADTSPFNLPPPPPLNERKSHTITSYDLAWGRATHPEQQLQQQLRSKIGSSLSSNSNSDRTSNGGESKSRSEASISPAVLNTLALPEDDILLDTEDADVEAEDNLDSRVNPLGELWGAAHVDQEAKAFVTQAVQIQFCDQMIILNDLCLFRLEVPLDAHRPVYLGVHLQFTSSPNFADGSAPAQRNVKFEWTTVSRKLLALGTQADYSSIRSGNPCMSQACPVVFEDLGYVSRANVIIHSCFIEPKFKYLPRNDILASNSNPSSSPNSTLVSDNSSLQPAHTDNFSQANGGSHAESGGSPSKLRSATLSTTSTNSTATSESSDQPPLAHFLFPSLKLSSSSHGGSSPENSTEASTLHASAAANPTAGASSSNSAVLTPDQDTDLPLSSEALKFAESQHASLLSSILRSYYAIAKALVLCQDLMTPAAMVALQEYMSTVSPYELTFPKQMIRREVLKQFEISPLPSPRSPVNPKVPEGIAPAIILSTTSFAPGSDPAAAPQTQPASSPGPEPTITAPAVQLTASVSAELPRVQGLTASPSKGEMLLNKNSSSAERDRLRALDSHVQVRSPRLEITEEHDSLESQYPTEVAFENENEDDVVVLPLPLPKDLFRPLTQRVKEPLMKSCLQIVQEDVSYMSRQTFSLWNLFVRILPFVSRRLRRFLLRDYRLREKDRIGSFIYAHSVPTKDSLLPFDTKLEELRDRMTNSVRRACAELVHDDTVVDAGILQQCMTQQHTVLFEDAFLDNLNNVEAPETKESASSSSDLGHDVQFPKLGSTLEGDMDLTTYFRDIIGADYSPQALASAGGVVRFPELLPPELTGAHLVVLCHGFQGSPADMRRIRQALKMWVPGTQVLVSSANSGKTEESVSACGSRLAGEVVSHLKSNPGIGRISFVGHSLGGVIIRAALRETIMQPYLHNLFTFVTLATPHVGYMFSSHSALVSTGLWFMRKWNATPSLDELSFADKDSLEQTFLYKLAQPPNHLRCFRHIFVFASRQDKYVPFHSARIELGNENDTRMTIYRSIVKNLLTAPLPSAGEAVDPPASRPTEGTEKITMQKSSIPKSSDKCRLKVFRRFDVVFKDPKRDINAFIGRYAHIEFLQNVQYFSMFLSRYWKAFL